MQPLQSSTVTFKRKRLVVALLACAATSPSFADVPFVNTKHLKPHVIFGPPEVMPANKSILVPAENQFIQPGLEKTRGAAQSVVDAKKTARISTGFDEHGTRTYIAQAAHRTSEGYLLGHIRRDDADSYEGGDGEEVNFGYERNMQQLVAGWTPNADTELKLVGVHDLIEDDKQPHHSMDPVKTDRKVARGFLTFQNAGPFDQLEWRGAVKVLDRAANNFDIRVNTAPANMRVKVDREVYEFGATGDFTIGELKNSVGFELSHDNHDAARYNVTAGDTINGYRFPDITKKGFSLWGQSSKMLQPNTELTGGLRYDYLHSEPGKADLVPGTAPPFRISARNLYQAYYGTSDLKVEDHNISGRARVEHDTQTEGLSVYGDLARLMRNPNNIERWHALPGPPSNRWVGNPQLDPEAHHKATLGFDWQGSQYVNYGRKRAGGDFLDSQAWKLSGSVYYDKVDNFITLDRARGQDGVLQSDGAIVSRNVDATLSGIKLDFQWVLSRNLATRVSAAYTHGDNDSDDRPLYQIAPWEVNWLLDYKGDLNTIGTWNVGSRVRHVGSQTRVDDDTSTGLGMDTGGKSEDFTLLDLYAGIQLRNRVGVNFGINNVTDEDYEEHLLGSHVASVSKTPVTAPGRTFYMTLVANF